LISFKPSAGSGLLGILGFSLLTTIGFGRRGEGKGLCGNSFASPCFITSGGYGALGTRFSGEGMGIWRQRPSLERQRISSGLLGGTGPALGWRRLGGTRGDGPATSRDGMRLLLWRPLPRCGLGMESCVASPHQQQGGCLFGTRWDGFPLGWGGKVGPEEGIREGGGEGRAIGDLNLHLRATGLPPCLHGLVLPAVLHDPP
jgi:hypothetical protein